MVNKNEIRLSKKSLIIGVIVIIIMIVIGFIIYQYNLNSKKTIAKIGNDAITIDELNKAYDSMPDLYKGVIDKKSLLEQLIQAKVFYLEAKKQGLVISEKVAKEKLEELKNLSGLDDKEFSDNLKEEGIDDKEFMENYVKQLTIQKFLDENLLNKIEISEKEIDDYYNKNEELFKVDEQVVVKHILIGDNNLSKEEQKSKANELLKKVNKDNFCEYVIKYSSDSGSIDNCGEFTFSKKDSLVKEFVDFSFKQKVNDIGIVETQYGYHIIWTVKKNPAKTLSLGEVKDELKENLKTEKAREGYKSFYENISKNYKIEITYNESI